MFESFQKTFILIFASIFFGTIFFFKLCISLGFLTLGIALLLPSFIGSIFGIGGLTSWFIVLVSCWIFVGYLIQNGDTRDQYIFGSSWQ